MSGLCPIVKYVVFAAIEDHFRCGWMALAPIGEWDFQNTRILAAARRRQRDALNRAGRRITMNISASNITPQQDAAHHAYFGGRIELVKQGYVENVVLHRCDIASLYPSAVQSTSCCEARRARSASR